MLRDLFPVTSNIVYMNCAAVGPLSVPAAEAIIAHAVDQREYGALPMDVRRSKISFLAADGHKWMCGPEGAAIFYVAKEKLEELDVLEHGWMNIARRGKFIDCPADLLPDACRFEAGSLNTNGIY